MKIYNLKCKILTPIHIGDGTEIYPYEYVIKDKFYKISLEDFILTLPSEKQKEVADLMEKDIIKFRQFLQENFDSEKHKFEYSAEVSQKIKTVYETKISDELNQLLISPFIRTLNKSYIPGSSLKGAIRTAVVANFFQGRNFKPYEAEPETLQYGYFDQETKKFKKDLTRDPFRAIKISDSVLPENSTIIDEIVTITKTGQIKTIREITYSGLTGKNIEFNVELCIDDTLLAKNNKIKQKLDMDILCNACNKFYKELVIPKEIQYFSNISETKKIYESMAFVKLDKSSFLIRLGWGSGKNSISLNLKLQRPQYIKTRRLIEQKFPLGWIEVTYA